MSESIIDHPIVIIDSLLKMGKGDKGRLLYLKKALINGKTIYESDKKYLKQMQKELSENGKFTNDSKPSKENTKFNLIKNNFSKPNNSKINQFSIPSKGKEQIENTNEIQSIQYLIEDIKKKDSKISDNLELISVNRQFFSNEIKITSSVKSNNISRDSSPNLFGSVHQRNYFEHINFLKVKNYDLMVYASAGMFSLWFSSFMNLVDLGPIRGLTLGLSAGFAVASGLFYKRYKKNSNHNNLE